MTTTPQAFPDHNTDPREKVKKPFMLQMTKACYNNWHTGMPAGSIFMAKAARYAEIRSYAMGRQSVNKYKAELLPEDDNNESWTKISWEPRQDGMVLRNIAVSKLQKAGYNILATPINPAAKDAQDEEYRKAKVKIMLREAVEQQAPELANHPMLKRLPGEAEDLEELQMEIDHNPKFIRAKDIEESVQLVFYENEIDKLWDGISEDIVDYGVGIVADDLDENNKVILRHWKPDNFGCSYSEEPDFSDITWAFQINSTKISDLSKYFDENDITQLVNQVIGKNGNPTNWGSNTIDNNGYDIFKANVMTLYFLSWDKRTIEENRDKNGNLKVSKAKPSKEGTHGNSTYTSKTVEQVYKCKWVVGTDLIYDFGKAENQKRSVTIATMGKTKLPIHIQAASFSNMRATGLTESTISIIDDLCIATYKLRNFRNRMIPNGFDIDLLAIENVAIGAGGQAMTPKEVIQMFFETGVLISRRSGISMDSNVNYKAINAISNNMADQIVSLANDIQMSKQALRDITGLNELTDGSTPNPKTLTTIANFANESTNNALYYLLNARRHLIESVAKGTVQRLQVALKRGAYDGFNRASGRWVTVPKSILDYDYDIMIEDRASEEQKQILYNLMADDIKNGYITHADVVAIIFSNNLKAAAILLSYRVEKNKKKQQLMAMQNTQATAQAQIQSNQMAEQVKLQADAERHRMKLEEIDLTKSWDYLIKQQQVGQANQAAQMKAGTEILKAGIIAPNPQGVPQDASAQEIPQEQLQEQ